MMWSDTATQLKNTPSILWVGLLWVVSIHYVVLHLLNKFFLIQCHWLRIPVRAAEWCLYNTVGWVWRVMSDRALRWRWRPWAVRPSPFCLRFDAQNSKSAVCRAHPAPEESSREVGTDARPRSPSWCAAQPQRAPEFAQTQPTRCLLIGAAILLHRNFFSSLFF